MKKLVPLVFSSFLLWFAAAGTLFAGEGRVEVFSPEGTVKAVRQVSVRFSEQMVAFGDPRLPDPFDISCSEKGHGRWADGKNWVYDFERDLPAGIACEFVLRPGTKTLSGDAVTGQQMFLFSTGGPSIRETFPHEGSLIEEEQAFILVLDTEPTEESVLSQGACVIEGIGERVGISVMKGEERENLLKTLQDDRYKGMPLMVVRCRRNFPNDSVVKLVWGKGITSLSGVPTSEEQVLPFKTRSPFTATFSCERENADADCIPILPMRLLFSSPIPWSDAEKIILRGHDRVYKALRERDAEEGEEDPSASDEHFVAGISFKGPFPEKAHFTVEIPKALTDDAGRELSDRGSFPLRVKTDSYPPLAKFSARFGIIELKGDATLPLTLRNIEPAVITRVLRADREQKGVDGKPNETTAVISARAGGNAAPSSSDAGKGAELHAGITARVRRITFSGESSIIKWLKKTASAEREKSIFGRGDQVKEFSLPKPGGAKAFEVLGIPLKEPGFYVVEIESRILGESLLGKPRPVYVPASALVTNLAAHFKWGRESSLVWVTTLDGAQPVKDASITVTDCHGKRLWTGKTDGSGLAKIKALPQEDGLPVCEGEINYREAGRALSGLGRGLFVFARTSEDSTFVHTSWDEGIEPWRYSLPEETYGGPVIAHTIFDRSLVRAGEALHMKHIIRKHTMAGFSWVDQKKLPTSVLIQHLGSDQRYQFPLKWDGKGVAETTWNIPHDAKLGHYEVRLLEKAADKPGARTAAGGDERGEEEYAVAKGWTSGNFRVEEFRVPLMKGVILPPKAALVNAHEADLDIMVTHLSGGGASNIPVKLRSQVQPKPIRFDDYEDFTFANGEVREEVIRRSSYEETGEISPGKKPVIQTAELKLDATGSLRTRISKIPSVTMPEDLLTELEFRDPNGEVQTVSRKIPLWPSKILVGLKPDSWTSSRESFRFHAVALDLAGKPVADAPIRVDLFERRYYSHRKRLVGGFYSYEHVTETKRVGTLCEGRTDEKGLLICDVASPVSGNVILSARAVDDEGNISAANRDVWIAGKGEWWFNVTDNDRIDLLPERKRYEPGETAKLQVRMPFRKATALVTVEREGVIETFIKRLSGKEPVIEIPVKKNYAPNIFVSTLVVRGRVKGIKPTALVDLAKPAYKLGIAEISVGWKAYELKVGVEPAKSIYHTREKAEVKIKARRADGTPPPKGSEVAVAAIDEGLLELMPNSSWKILDAMMGRRGYEVYTSTAQMQVVGKRHYGLKALPQGGGGGRQVTRELFDTLLFWKARVGLDSRGEADVVIPLNDSLTGFRIVAVATGGKDLFGTGEASIKTTQDLILLSGIPPLVREGDTFRAGFTVRNASDHAMYVVVKAKVDSGDNELRPIEEPLSAGEAKEIGWEIKAPAGRDALVYEVAAKERGGEASDSLRVTQKVIEALPVRTFQATLTQVEKRFSTEIAKPEGAISGKGGVSLSMRPKLSEGLAGVVRYMKGYPYSCMEQRVSKAVALKDRSLWKSVVAAIPSHLDSEGLLKYFPSCRQGSDVLTSYVLSISAEAGWEIPKDLKEKMEEGLKGFIEGKVLRYSPLPTADLSIRKVAALEALSRSGKAEPKLLDSVMIEPNLWPTSAVLDWTNLLLRTAGIPDREKRLREAEQILRSRLNFQGTTMGFSPEGTDNLWWLMVSTDLNAVKGVLTFLQFDGWKEDMPRIVRGAVSRQHRGAWDLTTANAWGVLAMEKFSNRFESVPVAGSTSATFAGNTKTVGWEKSREGRTVQFGWPPEKGKLTIAHHGTGKPWASIQSLAAIPLESPFSSGYRIKKVLSPVEQKTKGEWSRGDVVRVTLELEAQTDMTWVVVSDPVPAGSSILGTGLSRDSQILTGDEEKKGWVWPAFVERSFEAFRAYYEFVPKGKWTVDYTFRLNNGGKFHLPETRVEALYAPEMLGEIPNTRWEIKE